MYFIKYVAIYISIDSEGNAMNTIELTYTSSDDSITLKYDLATQHSVVEKWLMIWAEYHESMDRFSIESECSVTLKSLSYYHNQVLESCRTLVEDHNMELGEGWDSIPYNQQILNVLHADFAENAKFADIEAECTKVLTDLNHNIHTLEGAINGGYECFVTSSNSYSQSILRKPWEVTSMAAQLLTELDQAGKTSAFMEMHCLFLAYSTLGKDLETILKNDIELLESGKVEPKRTIGPWFSFNIPPKDGNISKEQESQINADNWQRMQKKANEEQIKEKFDVDVNDWIHVPGRHILGINNNGKRTDRDWFFANAGNCKLTQIVFATELLQANVVYEPTTDEYLFT